ncbi:MAG: TlpA family protein disulfide reductase [Candidatus Thiodiazotropha sp. (ex Epidulcina cf. delphinae)]|nr:TlpA family protein disulfide reductase [Candidatus Thiodiazotropha sp. (ex Epidulcina cf. delphinae)]
MITRHILAAAIALFPITAYTLGIGLRTYADPKPAVDFYLPDLAGRIHQLSDYKGKAYLFSFWATWCVPCVKEMPPLERAAKILQQDGIAVLTVNTGETQQEVERFLDRVAIDLPILLDPDAKAMDAWRVLALPTSYIVNRDGTIAARVVGGLAWDDPFVLDQVRALASGLY